MDLAQLSAGADFVKEHELASVAQDEGDHEDDAGLIGGLDHGFGLVEVDRHDLLTQDVLARARGGNGHLGVQVRRGANVHRIHFVQNAEVIGGKLAAGLLRFFARQGLVGIHTIDQLCARLGQDAIDMRGADATAADDGNSYFVHERSLQKGRTSEIRSIEFTLKVFTSCLRNYSEIFWPKI